MTGASTLQETSILPTCIKLLVPHSRHLFFFFQFNASLIFAVKPVENPWLHQENSLQMVDVPHLCDFKGLDRPICLEVSSNRGTPKSSIFRTYKPSTLEVPPLVETPIWEARLLKWVAPCQRMCWRSNWNSRRRWRRESETSACLQEKITGVRSREAQKGSNKYYIPKDIPWDSMG